MFFKLQLNSSWGQVKGMETQVNNGTGKEFTEKTALVCLLEE